MVLLSYYDSQFEYRFFLSFSGMTLYVQIYDTYLAFKTWRLKVEGKTSEHDSEKRVYKVCSRNFDSFWFATNWLKLTIGVRQGCSLSCTSSYLGLKYYRTSFDRQLKSKGLICSEARLKQIGSEMIITNFAQISSR